MASNGCDQVPPDLQFLAGLGTSGAHRNNMHRDLLRHFEKKSPLPPLYTTQGPLKNGHKPQSFLLPHELFSQMWEHYREAFKKLWMPGGESQIPLFWSKFQHHARFFWQSVHGDAVPIGGSIGNLWNVFWSVVMPQNFWCQEGSISFKMDLEPKAKFASSQSGGFFVSCLGFV